MDDKVEITICICTFRRPQVAQTLVSLNTLLVDPSWTVRIVVVDNDLEPSAHDIVKSAAAPLPYRLTYIHAPAGNISLARNTCLDAAEGDYIAFIDDDETVTPKWLIQMIAVAVQTRAQAVLGPVRALYDPMMPKWMLVGDFHSTFPVYVGREIVTGYTCNALLDRRSEMVNKLRFDLSRGRSGGEDTFYFDRLYRGGGKIVYATDAWVEEVVSQSRASLRWLALRRFRSGQTHGRILTAVNSGKTWRCWALLFAFTKLSYCLVAVAINMLSAVRWRRNYLRGVLHLGTICALAGWAEIEQYGVTSLNGKGTNTRR